MSVSYILFVVADCLPGLAVDVVEVAAEAIVVGVVEVEVEVKELVTPAAARNALGAGACAPGARCVNDPEICEAADSPRPIFTKRLLSDPVFFSNRSGGGTMASDAPELRCSCCKRAYCSCSARCLRSSS